MADQLAVLPMHSNIAELTQFSLGIPTTQNKKHTWEPRTLEEADHEPKDVQLGVGMESSLGESETAPGNFHQCQPPARPNALDD